MGRVLVPARVSAPATTRPIWPFEFRPSPVLAIAAIIAATALLPAGAAWIAALTAIIVLGVPHGALDGEIARTFLRPRFGAAWFPLFAVPYLTLFAVVMLAWDVAPIATLAAFLGASVMHFGTQDAPSGRGLQVLVRGGLPIATPVLLHPLATTSVLAGIAAVPIVAVPTWLWVAAWGWMGAGFIWVAASVQAGMSRRLVVPALLAGSFLVLPPLTAFALYFVCIHAPAHMATLIHGSARAPRVTDHASAFRLAMPITALTLLIGMALWPLYNGVLPVRLLGVTVQVLAALTLPHMVLDALMTARDRHMASTGDPAQPRGRRIGRLHQRSEGCQCGVPNPTAPAQHGRG